MNNVKVYIIIALTACCVLFIFLWLGELNTKAGYRKTISKLEEINRIVEAEYKELSEQNIKFRDAIEEHERERQEKYARADATIRELRKNSGELESGVEGILEQIERLEKAVSQLLAIVCY